MSVLTFLGVNQSPQDILNKNSFDEQSINDVLMEYIDINSYTSEEENEEHLNIFDRNFIKLPIVSDEVIQYKSTKKQFRKKEKVNITDIPLKQNFQQHYPWQKGYSLSSKYNGIIKLHYEILEFYKFIALTEQERKIREDIINFIRSLVLSYNASWKVEEHGSFLYGLCLPISEIDLLLIPFSPPKDLVHPLHKICEFLIKSNEFAYVTVVPLKKPFILLSHKQTNIKFKLSYSFPLFKEANQIIISILELYPYMKPILILLKYILYQKQLNMIQKGGISSYILFHMLYFYIQYLQKIQTNNDDNLLNLGELFIGFLECYGFNFNHNKLGISLNYGGYVYDKEEKQNLNRKNNLLSIENFQDPSKDLGQNCHCYKKILDCFRQIRDSLLFPSEPHFISYLGFFIYEDNCIKNRDVNV